MSLQDTINHPLVHWEHGAVLRAFWFVSRLTSSNLSRDNEVIQNMKPEYIGFRTWNESTVSLRVHYNLCQKVQEIKHSEKKLYQFRIYHLPCCVPES